MNKSGQGFATSAIHTKLEKSKYDASLGMAPAIFTSSVYKTPAEYKLNEPGTFVYGRYGNPSRDGAEAVISKMEGAKHTMLFSAGMSATNAVLEALIQTGDHVVASSQMYGGTFSLFKDYLPKIGVSLTLTNDSTPESILAALTPKTQLVWLEICSNPLIKILDIKPVVAAIRKYRRDIVIGVDNTFLSPYIIRPLEFGIDIVMHSVTKYLGGHSDVLMGCLSLNDESLFAKIKAVQQYRGATPGAFDCYLLHRSLYTLEVRMEKHQKNALQLAQFLSTHPCVASVVHPLLRSHPSFNLAQQQQLGRHSGIFAFYVRGGKAETQRLLAATKVVECAVSLGGVHSVMTMPTNTTHSALSVAEQETTGITENLIRISVGLEDPADLEKDLDRALRIATGADSRM